VRGSTHALDTTVLPGIAAVSVSFFFFFFFSFFLFLSILELSFEEMIGKVYTRNRKSFVCLHISGVRR